MWQDKIVPFATPTGGIRTIQHILPQAGDIVLRDALRKAQLLCHVQRDANLQNVHDSSIADAKCRSTQEITRLCHAQEGDAVARSLIHVSTPNGPPAYLIHCQVGIRGDDGTA